jgi:hypothetical protein
MLTLQTVTRSAPSGFTPQQWTTFQRDGILILPGVLSCTEVAAYLAAAQRCIGSQPNPNPGHSHKIPNAVTLDPLLADLIDHDRHLGFAYDLYGEQVRLVQSDLFSRPRQGSISKWHIDGPRVLPYRVFSPVLPLKLRIGYWLTDLPDSGMGNLIYLPGSHHADYDREHTGHDRLHGEQVLRVPAGTITVAHASLWHRVEANVSDQTRANLFLSYTPSWVAGYYEYDAGWLGRLRREQRIILRAYGDDKEAFSRPPARDLPLFVDDDEPSTEKELHKVRRRTRYERLLRGIA